MERKLNKQQLGQLVAKAVNKKLSANVEEKFYHNSYSVASLITTATLSNLMAIAQGDGDQARDGDRIRPKRCWAHIVVIRNTLDSYYRLCLVRYKPATVPSAANVFPETTTATAPVTKLPQWDQRQVAIVLWDSGVVASDTYHPMQTYNVEIPLDWNTQYQDTSTSLMTNGLYLGACSNLSSTGPTVVSHVTVSFTDA
jgi:hypothetical protein